ncbi:MAG: tetratricopeptide repeat-containing glycosyltransferase family protein [Leptolyngbyaceae cyanobacterium bins.302]|nr:tetratricopeptide repeat-containing glycosyltransferase family protein [Leptolyngbyaceae cyanobacterium bins.302]
MSSPSDLLSAAIQHHQSGRLLEAERLYEAVLLQQPDQANVLYLLGLANHQRGNLDAAVMWYERSIAVKPDYADAHNNLGVLLVQQGDLQQATVHYRAALQTNPNNAHAHANLGVILQQLNQFEAAIVHHQTAIQLDPNLAVAHTNLGHALKEIGQLDQAISHYQIARQLMPTNPDAYQDLGDALQEQGQFQEALNIYHRALAIAPNHVELNGSRIRSLLISGNLRQGFAEYDRWRLAISMQQRSFTQPVWEGFSLDGQPILLYAEPGSGFGDAIQFIRYAPLVANLGGRIMVECPAALVRLFQTIPSVEQVVAAGDPLPSFNVQASFLSLPRIFRTTLETIPNQVPYLYPNFALEHICPPLASASAIQLEQNRLKVGIVWGGDVNHYTDRDRSCPFQNFQQILNCPEVQFYSLQKGAHCSELADSRVVDLSDCLHDFADTATIINHLDLVITVDTAVAHLAGALGKPVWILLSFAADWRWLMARLDSPWYPTARLFRQTQRRDWAGVCQQVAIALNQTIASMQ